MGWTANGVHLNQCLLMIAASGQFYPLAFVKQLAILKLIIVYMCIV